MWKCSAKSCAVLSRGRRLKMILAIMTSGADDLMRRSHIASSSSERFMRSSMASKGLMQSSQGHNPAFALLTGSFFSILTGSCSTRDARSGQRINVRKNRTDVGCEVVFSEAVEEPRRRRAPLGLPHEVACTQKQDDSGLTRRDCIRCAPSWPRSMS